MSSPTGSGRCQVEDARDDVESFGPRPLSIRLGSSLCRVDRPGSMSSRVGSGRCRIIQARAIVESSGPMLNHSGSG